MPIPAGREPKPGDVLPSGARVPTQGRLRLYGLTARTWVDMLAGQGGVCALCDKVPQSGRMCTDHEHFPGWRKAWKRMTADERRRYVRGVLCPWCNGKLVGWRMTVEKARNTVKYLASYEKRRPKTNPKGKK